MATIVSFHAHPDDETMSTGGTLAKAADAGHRVVIVWATRGEHGCSPRIVPCRMSTISSRAAERGT